MTDSAGTAGGASPTGPGGLPPGSPDPAGSAPAASIRNPVVFGILGREFTPGGCQMDDQMQADLQELQECMDRAALLMDRIMTAARDGASKGKKGGIPGKSVRTPTAKHLLELPDVLGISTARLRAVLGISPNQISEARANPKIKIADLCGEPVARHVRLLYAWPGIIRPPVTIDDLIIAVGRALGRTVQGQSVSEWLGLEKSSASRWRNTGKRPQESVQQLMNTLRDASERMPSAVAYFAGSIAEPVG